MFTAIVPFRKGSKGLPGKNLFMLDNVPLWKRAVLQGLRTCEKVIYSTDYTVEIEELKNQNVIYDRRPDYLSNDFTKIEKVIGHLSKISVKSENLVLLQPTTPLRTDQNIKTAFELYSTEKFSMVMSVVERDRSVLKYGFVDKKGSFSFVNRPDYCFYNRQELPQVFGPNGAIYVFNGQRFLKITLFPQKVGVVTMSMDD